MTDTAHTCSRCGQTRRPIDPQRLREARLAAGHQTQQAFAVAAGLAPSQISRFERAARFASPHVLALLAAACGTDVDSLLQQTVIPDTTVRGAA